MTTNATRPEGLRAIDREMARQHADALASFHANGAMAARAAESLKRTGRLLLLGMGGSHAVGRAVEPLYRRLGIDAIALPLSEQLCAPLVLDGHGVRLEPLSMAHVPGLVVASADGDIGALNYTTAPDADSASVEAYVRAALDGQATGTMLPFAVLDAAGTVLGTTRYYDIDPGVPTLAIGHTWYRASAQRTHVNTACKRLLLGHAFDALGVRTVYLHTSHANLRSQAAIERLGAKKDGVIRQHRWHKDGSLRDTVCYSILDGEWPALRDRLAARLAAPPGGMR